MEPRVEEIISMYIDALNAGDPQPVETFLVQFPELPPRMAAGLRKTLAMLVALRRAPTESEEERTQDSWRRLERRMDVESSGRQEAEQLLAAFSSPTVGEYLSQTLADDPTSLKEFNIPEEVLRHMEEDDSPLQTIQTSAQERFRLAQHYSSHDQSLLSPIGALVTHLMRLWRSATAGTTSKHAFTRPAQSDHENN